MTEVPAGEVVPRSKALLLWYLSYQDPLLDSRAKLAKEPHDLASVLRSEYDEVESYCDLRLTAIQDRIENFFTDANRDDTLFLYLTGEGLKDPTSSDRHFLAAFDTDPASPARTAVSADFVRRCMARSLCLNQVVILDFCYSGGFMAGLQRGEGRARGRTLIVAATDAFQEEAAGPGWESGVLLDVVERGMRGHADRDGDGLVTGTEFADFVADYAYSRVQNATTYRRGSIDELAITAGFGPSPGPVAQNMAEETSEAEVVQVSEPEPPDADVDWLTDAPAEQDLLDRKALAGLVGDRLERIAEDRPDASFLVHVDGRWGTGKSTLLKFLRERLEPKFLVVEFDAWRQARLAHPWWSLLTAARDAIAADLGWWRAKGLRVREFFNRLRRTGAPYVFAFVLLAAFVVGLAVWLSPRQGTMDQWGAAAKVVTTVAAAIGVLWTAAVVASRFLLWNSARSAKLFEQSGANPLGEVSVHFSWLLRQARKPVVFFIDDLDRCGHGQVVDLLDTVQTLFRDAPCRAGDRKVPAPLFVVAADGAWLRKSFESAYQTFGECIAQPGKSLGYLFLDKIFQLTVRMPTLTETKQERYVDRLLRIADQEESAVVAETESLRQKLHENQGQEIEILDLMAEASPAAKAAVAGDAAMALIQPEVVTRTEHALRKFRPLLGDNPRGMKHFFNTYSIFRCVRTLEGNTPDRDTLALWSIVRMRWPNLFDHLEACPDAVTGILEPILVADHLPAELHEVATSASVREVFTSAMGGPLTAIRIRQCSGDLDAG